MPIFSMPPEVLTHIFLWAAALAKFQPKNHEAPLNVSRTCKAWRQLLLTSACFWTHFDTISAVPVQFELEGEFDIRLAMMWLERTRNATIAYRVGSQFEKRSDMADIAAWLSEISKRQSQWGELSLLYPHEKRLAIRTEPLGNLPNLRSWHFQGPSPFTVERDGPYIDYKPLFFVPDLNSTGQPIAPRLTTLHISRIFADRALQQGLLAMLRHCPNLESFLISYWNEGNDSGLRDDIPICVLSKLKQLTLIGNFEHLHLFKKLKAPALDSLNVSAPLRNHDLARDLLTIIHGLGLVQSLRKLVLNPMKYTFNKVAQRLLLEDFPELSFLYIDFPASTATCKLLSLAPRGSRLCPRLDELRICFEQPPNIDVLQRMLSSRFASNENFRVSIHINKMERGGKELLDTNSSFRQWKESGRLELGFDRHAMHRGLGFL